MNTLPRPPRTTGPSLRSRALQWLAQREHSRRELRTKLLRAAGGADADAEVDALLDQLAAQGHLNEMRFVESRVHARAQRFGSRRIEVELRQHGLAPDADTLQSLRSSELARARAVFAKKFGTAPAADAASRARQARFLSARGFSAEVVHKIVSLDQDNESP